VASLRCFAATPHLVTTLEVLIVSRDSGSIPIADLVHLRPLRALRSLHVRCLSTPVEEALLWLWTPGTAQFPARYWPRLAEVSLMRKRGR